MKSLGIQQTGEYLMEMPVGSETYLLLSVANWNNKKLEQFLIPMANWSDMLPKIILR